MAKKKKEQLNKKNLVSKKRQQEIFNTYKSLGLNTQESNFSSNNYNNLNFKPISIYESDGYVYTVSNSSNE